MKKHGRLQVTGISEVVHGFVEAFCREAAPPWPLNLASQMTLVSDTFDALRTRRAYHDPMEMEGIAVIMRRLSGTGLNPALTDNFLRLVARLGAKKMSGI